MRACDRIDAEVLDAQLSRVYADLEIFRIDSGGLDFSPFDLGFDHRWLARLFDWDRTLARTSA
jgi:hypothetical protein